MHVILESRHAGFNEWAESNNIVILYPYVKPSAEVPLNPKGCWDWWGYTNAEYGLKAGWQMQFVNELVRTLIK